MQDFTSQKLAQEWKISKHFINLKKRLLLIITFKNNKSHRRIKINCFWKTFPNYSIHFFQYFLVGTP